MLDLDNNAYQKVWVIVKSKNDRVYDPLDKVLNIIQKIVF